jgi:valyl-tRNA synthetase
VAFAIAIDVLAAVRRAKTEAKRSLKWPVDLVEVSETTERGAALQTVLEDVRGAANADSISVAVAAEANISVTLAAESPEA